MKTELTFKEIETLQSTMLHYPSEGIKYTPEWNALAKKLIKLRAEAEKFKSPWHKGRDINGNEGVFEDFEQSIGEA